MCGLTGKRCTKNVLKQQKSHKKTDLSSEKAGNQTLVVRFFYFSCMIIDTHSHLNFNAFAKDLNQVLKRTAEENIWTINVGTNYQTSRRAVVLAEKGGQEIYAAVGLHPLHGSSEFIKLKSDPQETDFLSAENDFDYKKYKELALNSNRKVVAIGEIGLDYYYKPKTNTKLGQFKEKQKKVFRQELALAEELNLPVILHCRLAHKDMIELLKSRILSCQPKIRGVVHCFTGQVEEMEEYINLGFYIGFNAIIFKLDLDEAVKNCPLGNMVVETDCPYLTPPQEGQNRNEPVFIKHTIGKIAELKGRTFNEICQKTTENAKKLFKI